MPARLGKARQGKFVRFALLLTLLVSALAAPPVSAEDPVSPSYLDAEAGTLSPIEVDSPEDEETEEEADDEELKPPDWCEVTPGLLPGPAVGIPAVPDAGGFGTASMSASSTGTVTEQAAVDPDGPGIPETGFCPPDPTVAAGPNHLMLAVNASIASYSKTPAKQWTTTFKSWLGPHVKSVLDPPGVDAAELFFYHPSLVYDQLAERFIFSLAAVDAVRTDEDQIPARTGASSVLIFGVSKTSHPNGGWCVYTIPASGYSHDPRIGYDDDFLFLTNNEYLPGDLGRVQAGVYMIPKAPITTSACGEGSYGARLGLLNPDLTLAMFVHPQMPADPQPTPGVKTSPYYLVSARGPGGLTGSTEESDEFVVWRVSNGVTVESRTVVLRDANGQPDPYYRPLPTGGVKEECVPGGRGWLDAYDARIRNAVLSDGRIWASQVVSRDKTPGADGGANITRLRVYGIDPLEAFEEDPDPDMVLRRDLDPPSEADSSHFNGAVMTTTGGDMAIGFNRNVSFEGGTSANHPSFWTARWLNGAWQSAVQVKPSPDCYQHEPIDGGIFGGSGAHGGTYGDPYRWGETTGASPDPDGSGIWFYGVHATEGRSWGTWLAKVTF